MKKILLLFGFFVVATTGIYAQVGIGTTDPDASAQLEVWAKNKGILIPRVEIKLLTQYHNPIEASAAERESLLVYNTATVKDKNVYPGYYYWYDGKWNRIISKDDFSNSEIIKEILKGSNVVVQEGDKFITYTSTTSGGIKTETVDIINVINNNSTTTKIKSEKIKPGTQSQVLATIGGVVTWTNLSDITVNGESVKAGKGVEINGLKELDQAVLKTFTITINELGLDQIKADGATEGSVVTIAPGGTLTTTKSLTLNQLTGDGDGTKSGSVVYVDGDGKVQQLPASDESGKVLTAKDDKGNLEWKKLDADNVESSNLSAVADGGIEFGTGDGNGVLLGKNKNVSLKIKDGGVTNLKLATDAVTAEKIKDKSVTPAKMNIDGAKPGEILKVKEDGSGTEWGKLDASNIDTKNITSTDITVEGGNDAVLNTVTLTISNVDISKVTVSDTSRDSYKDKLLTINSDGKFSPTNTLPADVKVDVNNIQGPEGPAGATKSETRVVVLNQDGTATTTTIKELVSNTVTVGNGLKKDDNGKIILGGDLDQKTTIDTKGNELVINSLTNTGTISTTVDKVVVLGKDNVMHTVSATAFKGSGDYKVSTTKEAEAVETGNVMTVDGGKPMKEKMVTIPIEVTATSTNSIHKDVVASMKGFGDYSGNTITEIRVFSKDKINISLSNKGVVTTYERRISFLAASIEGAGENTVITPSVGGGTTFAIYKGHYYVVIKFLEQ